MSKAILALEKAKAKLELVEHEKSEPIAIIGMACRFPGGADTPEAFFRLLESGVDAVTQVPASRWQLEPAEEAPVERRGLRWGGFLGEDVDRFDARFFGISPREAAHLDPQQRLLLEVAWEALERAGQDPARLVGSSTGTFVGISNNDYLDLLKAAGPEAENVYMATGNGHAFAAGRLSYALGLQGPSLAVDTVCSSSLVAVHLACQSLRNGESTLALAGGVNLMLTPDMTRLTATTEALSPDGRCKTFDASANGYVRGEGCGVVVLKLLSEARKDGDPILALIRGSVVNQDGRSTGLTTPNVLSQQAMLRQALANARVAAEEIGYVETHGTGTSLGDPIEFEALNAVIGASRNQQSSCVLGAVKSNIGHLEPAAGVAGLIKAVMVLREGIIPKNLHFRALNPRISLEGTPFVIPTENMPWARGGSPRFAGVSSFGMSGTNAHLILGEAPLEKRDESQERQASSYILPISAKSPEALQAISAAYAQVLGDADGAPLGDVAYTASVRRTHHEYRRAVVGRTREEMAAALARVGAQSSTAARRPKVVFVFSGQGSQWIGMGQRLLAEEPVFRAKLEECGEILKRHVSWSLLDELQAPADRSRLADTKIVQGVLFAIQVALSHLLKSWNVTPSAVIGHSVGEIAAAHVAGILSLDEAARLVGWRGRVMQKATGLGRMAWVALPPAEAAAAIAGYEAELGIAAINDPGSVVLAGATAPLEELIAALTGRGIECRWLKVNYAFHSPQMDPLARELVSALRRMDPKRGTIPFYSTVTGAVIPGEGLDKSYWGKNVREPVQFARAVASAFADGHRLFLEIGPHPVLSANLMQCLAAEEEEGHVLSTLRRESDERFVMLEALGGLYERGLDVDWKALHPSGGSSVPLPTYPWQRERYWVDVTPARRRPAATDPIADWFYRVDWPEVPRTPAGHPAASGSWLVLADRGGVGDAVATALSSRGLSCTVLHAPADASMLTEQVAKIAAGRDAFQGVLYLWGLDAVVDAEASAADVGEATHRAVSPVLALVRALAATPRSPRLWIVTRGACVVGGEADVAPCQAALWGMGRVAALEHAAGWGGLVDLDPEKSSAEVEALVAELLAPDTEDQLALRGGRRHAARLVTAPPEAPAAPPALSAEGSYLVTGGLGGLGLLVARWLVERGARHLVLTSRHGLPDRAAWGGEQSSDVSARIAAVEALESLGAHVTVAAVDVADAASMTALVTTVEPPLRGVVHAAGIGPVRPLAETDDALLESVLRSKVAGSWLLHRLLQSLPLDLFVLFSSGSAVWGGHGQGAYAAANAFLDGLAQQRRTQRLPALSVDWGVWAEGGMAEGEAQARLSEIGVLSMSTALALEALERLLGTHAAQRTVTRMDWARFAPVYAARRQRNLLAALVAEDDRSASRAAAPAASRSWQGMSLAEARPALHALVRETVAGVLGFADASELDTDRGFAEQGLDSLMAVQIRTRLQGKLGLSLSSTLAFDHPTVDRLAAHVLSDVLKLEDRSRVAGSRSHAVDEPIAIVGAACRFPGGAEGMDAYWRLLENGEIATSDVPASRWKVADWYDPSPETSGRTYVAKGGFLREIETFDPSFFRISPREAMSLDPQQRLLLEVSWEALENAGQAPASLRESPTGVFIGAGANEYAERLQGVADDAAGTYAATGNLLSITAGRLSFFLGLHGPTLAVDTACSSSLVALHLGCQSLRLGECDRALIGGVNVLLSPAGFVTLSRMRALSPDGRCKTFSAAADGYGRAEGCAVVVLKRLRDAERDGDHILAVIRGTAVNHDGASSGLTVPNGPAQQAVLREALTVAGVAPADVDFVECHGTGTALGDPIEVQALGAVYGQGRAAERPLWLGSAKANLGHLEPAAGMAGLLKVLLALEHERIPAQPGLGELNAHVPWDMLPVAVPREATPWPRRDRPRRAGLSAFGLSGTNVHVVIEEPPAAVVAPAAPERTAELLVLSARSAAALDEQAARLRDHLTTHASLSIGDVAFSLAMTRSQMEHRLAVVATSREEMLTALAAAAEGQTPPVRGFASPRGAPKVVFVFPGQGSQWLGMGKQLLLQEPVFRATMELCDRAIRAEAGWSLLAEIRAEEATSQLGRIDVVQPVLFAMEVALAALWRSWGVEPDAVVGHSMGEVAAAHVAGALSLEDAVTIICRRSLLMRRLSGQGEMAMVELSLADAEAALWGYEDRLSVAVSNSPTSTVLSGEPAALAEVLSALESRGVFCRRVKVDVASHSPQVDPLRDDLLTALRELEPTKAKVSMRSTVTGAAVDGPELAASYWADNLRQPVRFADAVLALTRSGHGLFVEMSPHPILVSSIEATCQAAEQDATAVGSLRRARDERSAMLEALGTLWTQGYPADWHRLFPRGGVRVPLPTYPWQRERYWVDLAPRRAAPAGDACRWPLAGVAVRMPGAVLHHVLPVSVRHQPFHAHHTAFGKVAVAGAFHVSVMLAIAAEHWPDRGIELVGVDFLRAITLDPDQEVELHAVLTPDAEGDGYHFELATCAEAERERRWTTHARGRVRPIDGLPGALPRPDTLEARATEPIELVSGVFDKLLMMQIGWGPLWRWIREAHAGQGCSVSTLAPTYPGAHDQAPLHPCLVDNSFASMILGHMGVVEDGAARVPIGFERLRWWRAPRGSVRCGATYRANTDGVTDYVLADEDGTVLAEVEGFNIRRAPRELFMREESSAANAAFYRIEWTDAPLSDSSQASHERDWVIVATPGSHRAAALVERLHPCVLTEPAGLAAALEGADASAGVICLWEARPGELPADTALRVAVEGTSVVQALEGRPVPPRLWWVTAGAVPVDSGDAVAPAAASVWGLGRTVMKEHPELGCKLIDLAPDDDLDSLVRELSVSDDENQVAWRAGHRRVARLARAGALAGRSGALPPMQGTALLTGGLGALGLHVARWLARQGVPHLVLTGRRGIDTPGAAEAVAELEALGARVTVAAVDVADREALRAVLEAIPEELPLRGIIHAAGLLDDGMIAQQNPERFARVFSPKVAGAWNLHDLTAGHDLAFFVMFSGFAGVIGSAGQSNYTAANAFLDALAAHRRSQGRVGQSLAWGPWAEGGLAAELSAAQQARLARQGSRALSPAQGIALLEQALARPEAQLGVVSLDLQVVGRELGAAVPPLWRALIRTSATRRRAADAPGAWAARLASLPQENRLDEVRATVQAEVAQVLSLSSASAVPVDRPFLELGLDSLMGVELRNALGRRTGVTLPATLAFDHPTANALARWLLAGVLNVTEPGAPDTKPSPKSRVDEPAAAKSTGRYSSLSGFEELRTLEGGRAARCCLRRADSGRPRPPLLLLHGVGCNHHYFAELAERLGHHDLLIPSLPGRCGSDGPPLSTVSEAARWVLDLLADVKLPPVVAVGHSYGGAIVMEVARMQAALPIEKRPIRGLVVMSTPRLPLEPKVTDLFTIQGEAAARNRTLHFLRSSSAQGAPEAILRRLAPALELTPMAASASDFAAVKDPALAGALREIDLPALLLTGSEDRVAPPRDAHYLARHAPRSRVLILEKVGHHPPLEIADTVAQHIQSFVDELDTRGGGSAERYTQVPASAE